MYGPRGKVVIALLFVGGAVGGGLLMKNLIMPALEAKKAEAAAKLQAETEKKPEQIKAEIKQPEKKPDEKKPDEKKPDDKKGTEIPPPKAVGVSVMDKVLQFPMKDEKGMNIPLLSLPFSKMDEPKHMVRAFFDRDSGDFAAAVKAKNVAAQTAMEPDRLGELAALRAWMKLPDADRKLTYDADAFTLPVELAKKPLTADYVKQGKVMIQAILTDRCIRCHADEEKTMFKDYATLKPYLEPLPPEKK